MKRRPGGRRAYDLTYLRYIINHLSDNTSLPFGQGQNPGAFNSTETMPQGMTSAPVLPNYLGLPFRIIVSPFMRFDPATKCTDIIMFNSANLGALIVKEDPHVKSWDEPRYNSSRWRSKSGRHRIFEDHFQQPYSDLRRRKTPGPPARAGPFAAIRRPLPSRSSAKRRNPSPAEGSRRGELATATRRCL